MQINYHKSYSNYLNREMEFKVFGHAGIVLLAFPSQDGRFYDYENRNLIQSISYQIDQGKAMVLCCDSIDLGLQNGKTSMIASVRTKHISITFTKNSYHYSVTYIQTKEKVKSTQPGAH
mgnify:CR=1 FL=1